MVFTQAQITAYKIVRSNGQGVMGDYVTEQLQQGWHLYGSPFTQQVDKNHYICQVMVKLAPQDKEIIK